MRAGRAPFALLLLALAASTSHLVAQEPNLYLAPALWHAGLSGTGQTGRGGSDERFNLGDDLGLDTGTSNRTLEFLFRFTRGSLEFGFSHGSHHSSTTLDNDLTFKNAFFPAGSQVRSDLNYNHRKLLYGMPFAESKTFAAGLRVGLYQYRIDTEVRQSGTGSPDEILKSVVPILGANFTFSMTQKLRFHGEALVTSLDRGGVKSHVRDAYVAMDYALFREYAGLTVGYRYNNLSAEDSGRVKYDLSEKGEFFGIFAKF
jgi:hypothetical protein